MTDGSPPPEDFETRFWLSTAAVGGWVTLLMVLAGGTYTLAFAEGGHRLGVGIMIALTAVVGVLVLWVVPWRRVIASRWREAWLLCWSLLTVGSVAVMAALDGGAKSPLALGLFLPTVFASLAYSLQRVVLVAATAEVAFGALTLVGPADPGFDLVFCSVLLGTAVMAVWQAGFHEAWRRKLARTSRSDPLTGVLNRRGLAQASDAAFAELARHMRPVTLLVIDLDLFKTYNDIHGHQAGDALLVWVASKLTAAVRPTDSVARVGGDEFAILLPDTTQAIAEPVLTRIRSALEPRIDHCLGWASAPVDGASFDELYRAADSELYQRKLLRPDQVFENSSSPTRSDRPQRRRRFSADAILAGITEAFFVLDEDWRFAYVNEAAAMRLERAPSELLGNSIWEVFPDTVGSRFDRIYRRVAATGRPAQFVESYEPLSSTFSIKASPVPGGISVYFHEVGGPPIAPRRPRPRSLTLGEGTSALPDGH